MIAATEKPRAMRGYKRDKQSYSAIAKRESKRRDVEDANEFAKVLAGICPEYFGGEQ